VVHLQRRLRRQPGAERQHALRHERRGILRQQQGDVAADVRAVVAGGPRNQHLRFGEQQRAVAVGFRLQGVEVGLEAAFVGGGAHPRAHQQNGGEHGEACHAGRQQHRHDAALVEIGEDR